MMSISVDKFYKNAGPRLGLRLVAGRQGLSRTITSPAAQKPGLALTGLSKIDHNRVQVLGEKEMTYLSSLGEEELELRLQDLLSGKVPAIIVTRNLDITPSMLIMADGQRTPLFRTSFDSGEFLAALSRYFEEAFTRVTTIHGVLVEVFGVGIMIAGASGVGKSEVALDLLTRGHSLVADDVIDVTLQQDNVLMGSGSQLIKYHMEVRGLGIINIRELFGITAVQERHSIDLVVELVDWDQRKEYDRLGLDEKTYSILDIPVAMVQIPVSPGRNLTTIIEVAARNHMLKRQGINTVETLHTRLSWALSSSETADGDSDPDDGEED